VKGGKIMGFRCVAIVGNQNGLVGVGCQAGREVAVAVKRTLVDAKKNVVRVPLVGAGTVSCLMLRWCGEGAAQVPAMQIGGAIE
jgi:ribosomal protein S5